MKKLVTAFVLLALASCTSKREDAQPVTPPTTTPAGKPHTITFNYVNRGLDAIKAGTPATAYNLGAGIRLYVDGKPLNLTNSLAKGDTTYFISPQTPASAISFNNSYVSTGSTLKMEVGYYNVIGTQAAPRAIGGGPIVLSGSSLTLIPVIDGVAPPNSMVVLSNQGSTAAPVYSYDNLHCPSRVVSLDLSKL